MPAYPKRLIEVDLPIKRISAHARREKSIRHGHISTLHIWWARRPLAACRAVICAALWPDPADGLCPEAFLTIAQTEMQAWTAFERQLLLSAESRERFEKARKNLLFFADPIQLRMALLDFIADFANWDNSTKTEFLATSRVLTQAAHEALGGVPGTRPLVVDPFAGGGSIPLEALRVGADAFASDLNPIPVLLNKVVLEYIPKYGQRLAEEVRHWGEWIKQEAEKELSQFYPKDEDGATPIAYLWARTIQCEGPGCGAEVPLIRSLWLAKKSSRSVALQLLPKPELKRVDFRILVKQREGWVSQDDGEKVLKPQLEGTVKRGSVTCPCCGYTTSAENARKQFIPRDGGANSSRLFAIVLQDKSGIRFRLENETDSNLLKLAQIRCQTKEANNKSNLCLIPDEELPYLRSIFNVNLLGVDTWGKLFNSRQLLALITLVEKTHIVMEKLSTSNNRDFSVAVVTCLAFAIDRCADYWSSLAVWAGDFVAHTFGRQALGIVWDYAEVCGFSGGSGNYSGAIDWICRVIERLQFDPISLATAEQASACIHPLPDNSAQGFFTDPPYYDAVPYADLSDFFYVWLKRSIGNVYPNLFKEKQTQKDGEIVQLSERNSMYAHKTREYFEKLMLEAMSEGRRILDDTGIGIVVFAHKTTTGWETQLQAMINAGWVITASWPIDTERPGRLRANNAAALASSVHLVCRSRDINATQEIGDWRDVLHELPKRIHDWMPRLAEEGVVGADAIFACLGPALEIFSRYHHVEKVSGEIVTLKEYLEHVWAAVAKEALTMIFTGADTAGFEEDARLTAMWLWTLNAANSNTASEEADDEDQEDEESSKKLSGGFSLEYDAARKIAQGLGAHLEDMRNLVEVKGDTARLLPVNERARYLFGKDQGQATPTKRKKLPQTDLFKTFTEIEQEEQTSTDIMLEKQGKTVLDRIHQSMILFAVGRSEALKRFLVDDGVGRDAHFWRLAQSLSALYPAQTDEKRWVDGVLARKKGLGF